jgi:hypothetical protein
LCMWTHVFFWIVYHFGNYLIVLNALPGEAQSYLSLFRLLNFSPQNRTVCI